MKGNIEAIAIKNLRELLREKGYTAEALFSKFDLDGDGYLSTAEFEGAITSITGQVAPQMIVDAVFNKVDADSSGVIDLTELLVLVESGRGSSELVDGSSIFISGHSDDTYNGIYTPGESINGKISFDNTNGRILYFFQTDGSSSTSWNLDDRGQDGMNDWYRGGWTRAPANGQPPLGRRRWVGVGEVNLEARVGEGGEAISPNVASAESSSNEEVSQQENQEVNSELNILLGEIDMALDYFENQAKEGKVSEKEVIKMANSSFEGKVSELPFYFQGPAREIWGQKMTVFENRIGNLFPGRAPEAVTASVIAASGIIAANSASEKSKPLDENEEVGVKSELVTVSEPEQEVFKEPGSGDFPSSDEIRETGEIITLQERDANDSVKTMGIDLAAAAASFEGTRMLSEKNELKEKYANRNIDVSFRVSSVERTFGIGISESFRGGETLVADIEEVGDVEIRLPNNLEESPYKSGYEGTLTIQIMDWNGVRKRLVLESQ